MRKMLSALQCTAFTIILLFLAQIAVAQTGTIKGTVKDVNGNPLSGASITIEGKKLGTTSDDNGNYILRVPPGSYTLVISFVGQSPQKLPVTVTESATTEQNVTLTGATDLGGIVIVGSRSREARTKISTPVPVDVISTKDIKPFAQTDVSQMLTYSAPSFQSARQTISDGTDHIDPAGLRGLGPDQTLVLVNGKRRHNTALVNINGTVGRGSVGTDLNAIPAAAIERIEVLRDGAAAQYGSDAIAGVINVVLKKKFNGFNISAFAGQNFTNMPYAGGMKINDGTNTQVDFSGGYANAKGAYINASGQWQRREKSNRSGIDNNPLIYYGSGGALPNAPAGSGVSNADYRRWLIDFDAAYAKQRGYDRHNIVAGNSYSNNFLGFVNAGTPITSNIDFYLTTGIGQRSGNASGFSRNPNNVNQQPVKANGERYYFDGFLPEIAPTIKDWSVLGGFSGKFADWDLDLSNTAGQNSIEYEIKNTGNASLGANNTPQTVFKAGKLTFFQNTINADASKKYTVGSNPLNVAFGAEFRSEIFQIDAGELNSYTNGGRIATIDPIPPYPGTTQSNNLGTVNTAPGAQVFPGFSPSDAVKAKRKVYAGYVDFEYTLNKLLLQVAGRYEYYDEKGFSYDNISGKLTARYEINENISVRGSVSNGFRAPSLHQRYFQNTSTQFVAGQPSNSLTANNYNPIVRNAFGITELKPEKSTSFTAGVAGKFGKGLTFTVDGYFISIKDRIVLSTPFNYTSSNGTGAKTPTQNIFDAYGVNSQVISALQFWTNAVNTETKGIDLVVTERFKLGSGNATLSLAANFNRNTVVGGTHGNSVIDSLKNNPSRTDPENNNPAFDLSTLLFDRQQRGRIETAQPRSKINLSFTYAMKKWDFLARAVRFGEIEYLHNVDPQAKRTSGVYWNDVGFGTDQVFDAKITTDLVISYKFKPGVSLSVGGNNIFDVYPDRIFVDPRNDPSAVYANPVAGANKTAGGYNSARDNSNRGRFLFPANQFGYNGRFLFSRLSVDIGQLIKKK